MENKKTMRLIMTSLFAALICAATFVIRIPTPTFGYIHPGDALVLLAGALLGPVYGGFAAGLGSALSDIFAGYFVYAPATAIIKALCAITAAVLTHAFSSFIKHDVYALLIAGFFAELIMVAGYFVFEMFLLGFEGGASDASASIQAGIVAAAAGVPFNAVQGIFGVVVSCALYPVLKKIKKNSEGSSSGQTFK